MNELHAMTARQLRAQIAEKKLGVKELVQYYLNRIQTFDGKLGLNSVAELNPEALQTAQAMDNGEINRELPLFGLPLLVKDNIDVCGLPTTAGSAALADNVAAHDARIITNLRKNGAIILGKTNLTEFANQLSDQMPAGYSSLGGQVINAYNRSKSPGGSSSGSAVAVSAGLCAAAIGTDTEFSVVGCAADNGVAGLKPPAGVLSSEGILPISCTLDISGPLTRNIDDALFIYNGMRDKRLCEIKAADPSKLRVAVNIYDRENVSADLLGLYEEVFRRLKAIVTQFTEIQQSDSPLLDELINLEFQYCLEKYLLKSNSKFKKLIDIAEYYKTHPNEMKFGIQKLESALSVTEAAPNGTVYLDVLHQRQQLRTEIISQLNDYDLCIMAGQTNIMHIAGLPSATIPMDMAKDNTPRGIIIYGADEHKLYAAALEIEKLCNGVRPPSV